MKFILTRPAYVGRGRDAQYIDARPEAPVIHTLPDDTPADFISRTWKPADKKAQALLAKLGVKAEITTLAEVAEETPAPAPASDAKVAANLAGQPVGSQPAATI